jgi:1-aminocyclopropane-1-carboxylate deaminase
LHGVLPSVIEPFALNGTTFFIKHDEQIHPLLSGNKYRKLYTLINTPSKTYHTLYSYGGIQSNAMLSLAALSQMKGWVFNYICKSIPRHLKEEPHGNYAHALALGMQVQEVEAKQYAQAIEQLQHLDDPHRCLVPQGGADPKAEQGIRILAEEILQWQHQQGIKQLRVVTPSGTGTTAYYLAGAMPTNEIVTTAVVGTSAYLYEQMHQLGPLPTNLTVLPKAKGLRFAQPDERLLQTYEVLLDAGLEIDLLYGTTMWHTMLAQLSNSKQPIMYLHSGGLLGNKSMLERYRFEQLRQ